MDVIWHEAICEAPEAKIATRLAEQLDAFPAECDVTEDRPPFRGTYGH